MTLFISSWYHFLHFVMIDSFLFFNEKRCIIAKILFFFSFFLCKSVNVVLCKLYHFILVFVKHKNLFHLFLPKMTFYLAFDCLILCVLVIIITCYKINSCYLFFIFLCVFFLCFFWWNLIKWFIAKICKTLYYIY